MKIQSYLTSEVPAGVLVYLPHEADAAFKAAIAAKDAQLSIYASAIVAMAEDGWLFHGPEGMDATQQQLYDCYLDIKSLSDAKQPDGGKE